ncbi:hypothetical protein O7606_21875 [Micromonospora sp. WMMD882]|uniref:hypothetical protein n=1 Tax=Micromonospora sp. WMMD882 TaxID=3015151 RepID=UPI00248CC7E9|nr:hypothetical protein [Micromonospora sp. WMMD882]WBB78825.1 hypothetical protein O7606_21875 [Micromonospora sp. WMMD882]
MTRLPRSRARLLAVVAAIVAAALLVALVVLRRADFLGVALALLVVLFTMVAMVAVDTARHQPPGGPPGGPEPARQPQDRPHSIDADTLETFDDPRMVAALRERYRRPEQ